MNCINEGKEYTPINSLDKEYISELETLNKKLERKDYINGLNISVVDVEALENLENLNILVDSKNYPNIFRWKNDIEKIRRNWKISKKPTNVKGRTFKQYIQIQLDKLNISEQEHSKKLPLFSKNTSDAINTKAQKNEEKTIHFFVKNPDNFNLKILVKFLPNSTVIFEEISPKIAVISHKFFKNKTTIYKGKGVKEKDGIDAILETTIERENYDIKELYDELKRNLTDIYKVEIIGIEKNEVK